MKLKRLLSLAVVTALTVTLAAGCSTGAGGSGKTFKIGSNLELTGNNAAYGQYAEKGIKMAIDEQNAAGGVLGGTQLDYVAGDNKSDNSEATGTVTKLITQDNVSLIIGAATSGDTIGASQVATDNKVPMITPTGTNVNVTTDDKGTLKPWIFRACFIDSFQGEVAAEFALNTLKVKNAAIFTDLKSDYSIGLASSFEKNFTAGGGKIADKENYSGGDQDFQAILTKAIAAGVDMIYVPGYYQEVGLLVKQARDQQFKGALMGGDGWSSPELANIAGANALNNTYFTNMLAMDDPQLADFNTKFKQKYNIEADTYAAMGYETAKMVIQAIQNAGSTDKDKIRDALENLKDFKGLTGTVSMDPKTHNPVRSAVILENKDGKQVFLTSVAPKN